MSGSGAAISRSRPREPKRVSIDCVTRRVSANPANTQKPTSQSQRKRKKTTRAPLSLIVDTVRPIAGQAVLGDHLDVGALGLQLAGEAAGRRVVTLADARGENQDPWGHRRGTLARSR